MYLIAYMEYRKWWRDNVSLWCIQYPATYETFLRVGRKFPEHLQPGFWSDES